MISADRRPLVIIAGAVFAGFIGWKVVKWMCQEKPMLTNKRQIPEPTKRNSEISIRNDKKAYFLELMRLGEQCLAVGKYDEAVEHLANAIMFCENNESLNEIFKTSLPQPIYEKLQKVVKVKTELKRAQKREKEYSENFPDKNTTSEV